MSITVTIVSPSICHEVMGSDARIFVFWMLNFKSTFSLSSFTFIKRLFSSSSLSAIRVVSSAYLRLLIFLLAILILACASYSPAFLMIYSVYKQGDSIQPWGTPFPIWNQHVVPCPVLTVASWPAYGYLKRQIRWSGISISLRIFHSLWRSIQSNWEGNGTPPVLLPGNSHGQRSLVGCSPWGREESDTTERLRFQFSFSCIGEGYGNPLHYSCLENLRDGGTWWAVYGIAQSQTWLKWLSSLAHSQRLWYSQ